MAEVFYARTLEGPRAGQFVAIKRLIPQMARQPEAVELFLAEADIMRILDHENIVKTLEIGVLDTQYYLVMEAIDGRDLGQLIRRCQQLRIFLPIDFACFLVKSLLDALDCVHRARSKTGTPLNLVHCDVSPQNVFISRGGEIKLGDFGIAQSSSVAEADSGRVRGKLSYLPPEALGGSLTAQCDLWAATVTLYELLTLELPFKGASEDQQLEAIRKRRWVPARTLRPEVPAQLEAVLTRGFEKKPIHRYADAAAFAAALTPHFDPHVGTPLAIASLVRGLFDHKAQDPATV